MKYSKFDEPDKNTCSFGSEIFWISLYPYIKGFENLFKV